MLRSQKQTEIDGIKDRFGRMISAVLVDYQGLTVSEVTDLRDQLREKEVDYKVCKNTLTRLAIKDEDWASDLDGALVGMTAIAWSYEEPAAAAKVFKDFVKKNKNLKVKAAVIDGTVLDSEAVMNQLATMPGKNELRAKLLATFQAPSQQFVRLLQAPSQNFLYLLTAKKEKEEG